MFKITGNRARPLCTGGPANRVHGQFWIGGVWETQAIPVLGAPGANRRKPNILDRNS